MRQINSDSTRLPIWARIVCGLLGGVLFIGGAGAFLLFAARPFDTKIATLCVGAAVPGMVLIAAAISGYRPLFIS